MASEPGPSKRLHIVLPASPKASSPYSTFPGFRNSSKDTTRLPDQGFSLDAVTMCRLSRPSPLLPAPIPPPPPTPGSFWIPFWAQPSRSPGACWGRVAAARPLLLFSPIPHGLRCSGHPHGSATDPAIPTPSVPFPPPSPNSAEPRPAMPPWTGRCTLSKSLHRVPISFVGRPHTRRKPTFHLLFQIRAGLSWEVGHSLERAHHFG